MWAWHAHSVPYGYPYGIYGYPWAVMAKEEEVAMLEEQERYLTGELDGVSKRLGELKK